MRAVIQRVKESRVEVKGETVGRIGRGLLVLLGVGENDTEDDSRYLADKVSSLRIFADSRGMMNLSVGEVSGSVLIVSQFTLWGDCRKGRRPSFTRAAEPEKARRLYDRFVEKVASRGLPVATGIFGEMMDVHLVNDGPVTLLLDSEKAF
ncbi:MAG: D-tyrosyl-tRNA(Tyr) deacylase [Deltaproteobacteria bacterium]|nr:D-tyrosyl-tRNA(Tyr) deacylase [Deltaproteobacteria bacterium]MBW1948615.1 D-tyrosyl-tRNA(Tyr) deacylase [Deltaproteobacteria bacterium]MBW2009508.1 D-tyrosyl-tRNA(Tyr) deacylase [Deltaproteobacteria bacterium]MBW2101059.1 D-tyrosyl-tRNA(Tyr) deacylase [Deltaproteobacteria bacterium]MBW2349428.1 D-tyrosyl-tRNA(Tyr) deacylase [Deltaproteobacteria bacterium]